MAVEVTGVVKHTRRTKGAKLRFVQLVAAQWQGQDGRASYSLLALADDGRVYRYDPECKGWLIYPNVRTADCFIGKEHRR